GAPGWGRRICPRTGAPIPGPAAGGRGGGRAHDDGGEVLLEAIEETAGAEDEKYGEAELRETLRRTLTRGELDITQALMEGFTQAEIARELGISQQAVAARLKKIRDKLRPLIRRED
uniref:LuxR C-terminal-related transcriptional regulator n=1 Tax=uncultured Cloacibacillus sp. TaxID=889794 RepID=UPI0025D97560